MALEGAAESELLSHIELESSANSRSSLGGGRKREKSRTGEIFTARFFFSGRESFRDQRAGFLGEGGGARGGGGSMVGRRFSVLFL